MVIKRMTKDDELRIRRYVTRTDPELGLHSQLSQYFLAPTEQFGTLAIEDEGKISALFLYSIMEEKNRAFVHYMIGDGQQLELVRQFLNLSVQAFVRRGEPSPEGIEGWVKVLDVYPGMVVEHSAYSGVFSRVAPRFHGMVWEHD